MNKKPPIRTGIIRIIYAFSYTFAGLRHAVKYENAFRQEVLLFIPGLSAMLFMPITSEIKLLLFLTSLLVLIVELLNSAIEAVVDKASPEYHTLAKQAKDMGSAAVFISFVGCGVVWSYAIVQLF